jgi:hypothetical protein
MSRDVEELDATATEAAPAGTENTVNDEAGDGTSADSAPVTEKAPEGSSAEKPAEPEKPAGPTDDELKAAWSGFEAAVGKPEPAEGAIGARDLASGEMGDAATSAVTEAYKALLTTSQKRQAREFLESAMKAALSEKLDAVLARAYMQLGNAVKSTGAARETVARAPVDPTTAHVERVASIYLATSMVAPPSGVAENWATRVQELANSLGGEVQAYLNYLAAKAEWDAKDEATRGDEPKAPEVSDVVVQAAKIARGRAVSTRKTSGTKGDSAPRVSGPGYSGPRRSVGAHIQAAFASQPVGTFLKISEIAGATSEEYGDDHPSSGAVSAALFPASGKVRDLGGIEPAIENGNKGARKIA